jgi:formate dehydrogenase subunit delta
VQNQDIVRMTNQISTFFKTYGEKEAIEGIADHINKFWDPRMRKDFFTLVDGSGTGLDDLVKKAAAKIKRPKV